MEFKGTKGKWEVEFDTKNLIKYVKGEHIYIAEVGFGNEEKRANALLISKAPEMLEMLKEQYDFIIYCRDNMKDSRGVFNQKALRLQSLIKESTEIN